jgi:hypothetical protein
MQSAEPQPTMQPDEPVSTGLILRFEPRKITALRGRTPFAAPPTSPVDDIDKYMHRASDDLGDNDDRRMVGNAVASMILVALIVAGVWLADTIVKMRDIQDCVLSGRGNCFPIARPTDRRP